MISDREWVAMAADGSVMLRFLGQSLEQATERLLELNLSGTDASKDEAYSLLHRAQVLAELRDDILEQGEYALSKMKGPR